MGRFDGLSKPICRDRGLLSAAAGPNFLVPILAAAQNLCAQPLALIVFLTAHCSCLHGPRLPLQQGPMPLETSC